MICSGCGNQEAWHKTFVQDHEMCDGCGLEGGGAGVPDVYFTKSGEKFDNLCDDMGRPIEITSKRHKKEVMDRLGVREAGDLVNGSKYGSKSWIEGTRDYRKKQFDRERPMIRDTYKRYLDKVRRP